MTLCLDSLAAGIDYSLADFLLRLLVAQSRHPAVVQLRHQQAARKLPQKTLQQTSQAGSEMSDE